MTPGQAAYEAFVRADAICSFQAFEQAWERAAQAAIDCYNDNVVKQHRVDVLAQRLPESTVTGLHEPYNVGITLRATPKLVEMPGVYNTELLKEVNQLRAAVDELKRDSARVDILWGIIRNEAPELYERIAVKK